MNGEMRDPDAARVPDTGTSTQELADAGGTAPAGQGGRAVFPGDATSDTLTAQPAVDAARAPDGEEPDRPLLDGAQEQEIRARWQSVQADFVDDPRRAVQSADGLVAELMQQLAAFFAQQREELEGRWNQGEQVQTEDLRMALQQYRSFFNRLLTT